ncbi:MAG: ADP-ribosylglycohydrolase family protein [Calditrichia bacterium]
MKSNGNSFKKDFIKGGLWGFIVGDSVGLPVKGQPKEFRNIHPIETITGWGTFNLPPGQWSDESSVLLATISSLIHNDRDLLDELRGFYYEGAFTPDKKVIEIAHSTKSAIENYASKMENDTSIINENVENGSDKIGFVLIPFIRYLKEGTENIISEKEMKIWQYFHSTSIFPFGLYFISLLSYSILSNENQLPIQEHIKLVLNKLNQLKPFKKAVKEFIAKGKTFDLNAADIPSPSEHIFDVIWAALWAIKKGKDYESSVLSVVNLGGITDTSAALTGFWAGLLYGIEAIPESWLEYVEAKNSLNEQFLKLIDKYLSAEVED